MDEKCWKACECKWMQNIQMCFMHTLKHHPSHHWKRTKLQQHPRKRIRNETEVDCRWCLLSFQLNLYNVNPSCYPLAICIHMYWEWRRVLKGEKVGEGGNNDISNFQDICRNAYKLKLLPLQRGKCREICGVVGMGCGVSLGEE